ncbi:MAG: enoyl-ACP reductase FabI [Polyangiales bacterium]
MAGDNELLQLRGWALVLGASSGFGGAASVQLAQAGLNIIGVHLDRRATMPNVERIQAQIRAHGKEALFFNINAADEEKRRSTLAQVKAHFDKVGERDGVRVLLHSLAFGTLKPYWSEDAGAPTITKSNMDMTLDVMAHSLVYWAQDCAKEGVFGKPGRIFAMTSSGSTSVWQGYGAVSAAKAALEAHIRQLAVELAPLGITANALCAGVTDTPALRKIPGSEQMIDTATARNPYRRLTTPQDVAKAMVALATPATSWINGNTIYVDGGEEISG